MDYQMFPKPSNLTYGQKKKKKEEGVGGAGGSNNPSRVNFGIPR